MVKFIITYFERNKEISYSIEKVFETIQNELSAQLKFNCVVMPSKGSMPWDVLKNSYFTYKNRNTSGINHITGHIHDVVLGLLGCKTVITFHDLVFLDNVNNPIKKVYKWLFWFYIPIKCANRIVCISEHTRQNILRRIKAKNLTVIHNPIDPEYRYLHKDFNAIKPIILHIGTGWNKNLRRTIFALESLSCHLRIIGRVSPEIIEVLHEKKIDFSNVYNLTDKEIRQEYENADIISFPSEYEGFGMPIIEGQKVGRCILTSSLPPMNEVAGKAAVFVDPFNVSSIRAGFVSLLQNEELRRELIKEGRKNCDRFDGEVIAQKYLNLYQSILSEK